MVQRRAPHAQRARSWYFQRKGRRERRASKCPSNHRSPKPQGSAQEVQGDREVDGKQEELRRGVGGAEVPHQQPRLGQCSRLAHQRAYLQKPGAGEYQLGRRLLLRTNGAHNTFEGFLSLSGANTQQERTVLRLPAKPVPMAPQTAAAAVSLLCDKITAFMLAVTTHPLRLAASVNAGKFFKFLFKRPSR